MGKNRGLFKKNGNIKGTFHARKGMIKRRNGTDLTKAGNRLEVLDIFYLSLKQQEETNRCQILSITMNKASGSDGIPVKLFQILKDNAVKVLHSICQQVWKTQQWPQDWKGSVFIPIPKKGNEKECSNYCTIALISHASKVILKNSPSQVSAICEP